MNKLSPSKTDDIAMSSLGDAPTRLVIDSAIVAALSKLKTHRWLVACSIDWAMIVAAVYCAITFEHLLVAITAILLIGNRQHALAILMHEGVHFRVCGNHRLNDILSNILCGYPIFISTFNYRVFHLAHHRWLDTPKDPEGDFYFRYPREAAFPQKPWRFIAYFVRDLSGLWPSSLLWLGGRIWNLPGQSKFQLIPICVFHVAIVSMLFANQLLYVYFLFWLLPFATVFAATFRIRGLTEHLGIVDAGPVRYVRETPNVLATTRSIAGLVGRHLFGPHSINFHLEHHLYPSVPFHNLAKLSRELRKEHANEMLLRVRTNYFTAISELLDFGTCNRETEAGALQVDDHSGEQPK